MNFTKLGGRRFVLAIISIFTTALLTWFAKISSDTYSYIMITTITTLIAGHTIENTVVKIKEKEKE